MIEINNLTNISVDKKLLKNIAQRVLNEENKKRKDLSIAFVNLNKIKEINKKYKGKNKITDVLSFSGIGINFIPQDKNLGEIIICLKEVKKNAKKYKSEFKTEITRVLIHGILHLLGYDHEKSEKETKKMENKQNYYLSLLNN